MLRLFLLNPNSYIALLVNKWTYAWTGGFDDRVFAVSLLNDFDMNLRGVIKMSYRCCESPQFILYIKVK